MYRDLTARQQQFLQFVLSFMEDNGYSPSIREIQRAFSLKSTKGVKGHIDILVERGYLNRKDGSARALSLPGKRSGHGRRTEDIWAPVIGRVAAGLPILAEENEEGRMPVPDRFIGVEGLFWLEVHGDSMIDAGILNGDFVLVRPVPFVEEGTVAVILIDYEATVKKFYHRGDTIRLVPANDNYKTMEFHGSACSSIQVAGKVIALFRYTV
jgi:repressor LexA